MRTPKEVAAIAAKALDDRKGVDIALLEIAEVTTLADHFLICTGTSSTHVKALCDSVEEALDNAGEPALRREGHRGGTWVLLDYGCLVVHVFTEETRSFYDLERLWGDAKKVDLETVINN
ncbi:MAG: ribosome silencing factor [Oscillospiraceae bacterium]|nr:ribosome silencing factor [Oscillospiraceae bacterium]